MNRFVCLLALCILAFASCQQENIISYYGRAITTPELNRETVFLPSIFRDKLSSADNARLERTIERTRLGDYKHYVYPYSIDGVDVELEQYVMEHTSFKVRGNDHPFYLYR